MRLIAMFATALACATAYAQDSPPLQSEMEKLSYALGMDLGNQLRKAAIQVDPVRFGQGLKDALAAGKTLLTAGEVRALISGLQAQQKPKQAEPAKESGESEAEIEMLGAYNAKVGESFLAANKKKEGVVALPSGLQYKILRAGAGPHPAPSDTVTCHIRATLLDGTELDNTQKRNQPSTIKINAAIPALNEALPLMTVGSKWELAVPPALAYGASGAGPIGPNAALNYEVELLSIR